ncbi:unnamed protein product [Brassica oleracea]
MPLWRETSVELSSLRSKGLHPCLYFSCLQFFFFNSFAFPCGHNVCSNDESLFNLK